jgi:hypothetical protein
MFLRFIFLIGSLFLLTLPTYAYRVTQGTGTSSGGTLPILLDLNNSCISTNERHPQGSSQPCENKNAIAFSSLLPEPCPNKERLAQGETECTPAAIIINQISDITKNEYYAPFEIDPNIEYSGSDKLYYYVESNNSNFIEASVDTDGIIEITAAQNSGGTGEARIMFIVFSAYDVSSYFFNIKIDASDFSDFSPLDFEIVSDEQWDELAVRKVLDTFALGGHATDIQIQTWADMPPKYAIVQMLTFDAQNPLLSPTEKSIPQTYSIETVLNFFSGDSSDNFIDEKDRDNYDPSSWDSPANGWLLSVMMRGLNPFMHWVGLWETNYHMSVNQDADIYLKVIVRHYDNILDALGTNSTYNSVLAQGAKNAAIAYQYGHNYNVYENGIFEGNEDFAREYHQLFLGILGEYDHSYHELTAIPNTARALTDMNAFWHSSANGGPDLEILFGTDKHYTPDLDILNTSISGVDASYKLDAIALAGIEHSESLDNLPVMIVKHFADDNLTAEAISRIQSSWQSMNQKYLLPFIWAYALSTDFHSPKRFKYATSIQRTVGVLNKIIVENEDHRYGKYNPNWFLSHEGIGIFRPIHDVFGHQTSMEASDNANVFRVNYNRSVSRSYLYTNDYVCIKDESGSCPRDENDVKIATWEKDWAKKIPSNAQGEYIVEDVARWLWNHFIADGGKNYGVLERVHIIALLNGKDIALFLDEDDPLHNYTLEDFTSNSTIVQAINDGAVAKMALNSVDLEDRRDANYQVGLAIAFIVATPYIFAQEGL